MSLKQSIKRILREEVNNSLFFYRRVNFDEVKKRLSSYSPQVYYETESYKQFKYELTLKVVESIMWDDYGLGWEDLPEEEEIDFVNKVSDVFEEYIKIIYNAVSLGREDY